MPRTAKHVLLLLAVCGLVFFTNLGVPRLWDRDEPRNAGCAREMLQRGDWVVPVFNAELRVHKPVLLYWFIMTGYAMFGDNEWGARFWSAVLGTGTVLMTYWIGRRLFNPTAAVWSGVVLATSLLFGVSARAATPDSTLVFFSTAALLVFVLGTFRAKPDDADGNELPPEPREPGRFFPQSWPVVALMYALMGVAVLAKGPVGLVLPTAIIGMFLLVMRLPERAEADKEGVEEPRSRRALRTMLRPFAPGHFLRTAWSMRPITAIVVASLVAVPWYVMVAQRTDGAWTRGFFLEHNVGRAMNAMEGHGGDTLVYPFMVLFYYPAVTLAFFLPWSILLVPILIDLVARIRRRHPWYAGYVFAACWAGVVIGIFSIPRTKLPTYSTPMYPGLALIAGTFLYHLTRGAAVAGMKSVTDAMRLLLGVGVGAVVGLVGFAVLYRMGVLTRQQDGVGPLALAGGLAADPWIIAVAVVAAAGAWWVLRLLNEGRLRSAGVAYGALAVLLMTLVHGFVTVSIDRRQQSHRLLAAIRSRSDAPHIATFNRLEPSWVYYAEQTLPTLKRTEEARDFLSRGNDAFIITDDEHFEKLQPALPPGVGVLETVPYFGRKGRLVVVGPTGDAGLPETASGRT